MCAIRVSGTSCALMPTEDFVRKLVEMREVIEPAAAAAAAVRCSVEQLERLDAAYAAMAAAKDLDAWTQAAALAEKAFGPDLPPPACHPRSTR